MRALLSGSVFETVKNRSFCRRLQGCTRGVFENTSRQECTHLFPSPHRYATLAAMPKEPQIFRVVAMTALMLAAGSARAAEPDLSEAPLLSLELRGVGELRFGDAFQWSLVVAPPKEVRRGEG